MVETTERPLLYTYSASTLSVAYGIALGMSLFSFLTGAFTISRNGGYLFTTEFSTILRTVQAAYWSAGLQASDGHGNDPIPKHVEKIVISFPENGKIVYQPAPAYEVSQQRRVL